MHNIDFVFISEAEQVLRHLEDSKNNNTVIAISAPILGSGVFLTSVSEVIPLQGDYIIVLKGYDVTGYILERNKIKLSDIRSVYPFRSEFKNPYLKELAEGLIQVP
jgi:hypothetical protein